MDNSNFEWIVIDLIAGVIQLVSVMVQTFTCLSPGWAGEIRRDRPVYFGVFEYSMIIISPILWCKWMVNLFLFVQSLTHIAVYTTQQLLCFRSGRPNNAAFSIRNFPSREIYKHCDDQQMSSNWHLKQTW